MIDFSIPLNGLNRAAAAVDQSARRIATAGLATEAPADTVDLSAEMVALMAAKNAFAANANLVRAEEELTQSLLNVLG